MTSSELAIVIRAKNEASAVLKQVEGSVSGLGSKMGTALKVGALGAAAGIGVAAYALKGFVEDAMESQKIMTQTNAVIASTAGVSGMTAKSVSDLANSLSKVIPVDDELIQQTENMLLTFTNVGKDVFPVATEAALNMATALGGDPVDAALKLGKALNDPIAGVTALRKVGVQLTDAQRDQIKVMVESGDIMGAQTVILKELETEFGNSGRAAGETFAGKMKILQTQIGNVKEGIGMALLPVLMKLADLAVAYVVPAIEDTVQALTDFGNLIGAALAGDVGKAAELFNKLPGPLQAIALWLGENKKAIEGFVLAAAEIAKSVAIDTLRGWQDILVALAPKLQEFGQFIIDHRPLLIALGVSIAVVLGLLVGWPVLIVGVLIAAGYLTTKIQEWRKENESLDTTLTGVGLTLQGLAALLGVVSEAVGVATGFVADHKSVQIALGVALAPVFAGLFVLVSTFYAIGVAADVASGVLDRAKSVMEWVKERAYDARDAVYGLRDAFYGLRDAIGEAIGKLNFFNRIPGVGAIRDRLGFAAGGIVPGGLTLVGERGPELVNLPGGSRVFSNSDSRQMAAGGAAPIVQNIYIQTYQNVGDAQAGLASMGAMFA